MYGYSLGMRTASTIVQNKYPKKSLDGHYPVGSLTWFKNEGKRIWDGLCANSWRDPAQSIMAESLAMHWC
jgi:hypothetical protein